MSRERKLREIYDAIEQYRFPQAITNANQIIKRGSKGGGDQVLVLTAKALKALALIKTSRADEATPLIAEVKASPSLDEATLQAITACCRELGNFTDIAELYDVAVKSNPQNEEMASQLFMSLVRLKQYKRQQQVATAMFKSFGKNPYYYWGVMSAVMQALEARANGQGRLADMMFLPLAEKMVTKAIEEKRLDASETLRLYLMILEEQGKFEQYLEVIQKDQDGGFREAHPLMPLETDRERLRTSVLCKTKNWDAAAASLRRMVALDPDEWSNYIQLVSVAKNAAAEEGETSEVNTTASLEAFIEETVKGVLEGDKPCRGPFLARLELRQYQSTLGADALDTALLEKQLLDYVALFGAKLCCFSDVKAYLSLLPAEVRGTFLDKLHAQLPAAGEDVEPAMQAKHAQRHISVVQIQNLLSQSNTVEEREAVVADLLVRYDTITPLGKDLKETEWQFSDPYAMLVTQNLYHLYNESGDASYLHRSAVMLERAIAASKHNAQLRLLAVKVFVLLGAVEKAEEHWKACDVKQIQLDSIGYIMTDHIMYLGALPSTETLYSRTNNFFINTNREFSEFVVNAYRYGSFNKIIEFTKFEKRIKTSMQSASISAESLHYLIMKDNVTVWIPADLTSLATDEDLLMMSDNRDLDAMDSYEEYPELVKEQTFDSRVLWARLRRIQLECLQAVGSGRVDLLEELLAKYSNVFTEGKASVVKKDGALSRTCFVHGIQYPRDSMFSQFERFGIGEDLFKTSMLVAAEATFLNNKPTRGDELKSKISSIKDLMANVSAQLEAIVKSPHMDAVRVKAKTLDGMMQNELELLVVISEQLLVPVMVAKDILNDVAPSDSRKENKQARQTREKVREAFIEFGAILNATVANLVAVVTSYDEADEEDSVKSMADQVAALQLVPAGDAAGDSTSTSGFAEGILKEIRASRITSLKNIQNVLEQMTIMEK